MINIICGKINQGKTEKIRSAYLNEKQGDGFITQKIFKDTLFCGYELIRLSTGESAVQSLKREIFPEDETPYFSYGPFSFYRRGFDLADSIICDVIEKKTDPVFIDEIGPIELCGRGHHDLFRKILKADRNLYFTVRDYCLDDVIALFSIRNYKLIKI